MRTEYQISARVYYEDTDAGGVVYHSNYLKFMERARTEWLRSLGIEQDYYLQNGIAFVVKNIQVDYILPARFNQHLSVSCQMIECRRASLTFKQTVRSYDQNDLFVAGQVTVACVDMNRGKPIAIPKQMVEVLARVG